MKRTGTLGVLALFALALSVLVVPSTASAAKFVSEAEMTAFSNDSGTQHLGFGTSIPMSCPSLLLNGTANGNPTTTGYAAAGLKDNFTGTEPCDSGSIDWDDCNLTFHPPADGVSQGSVEIGPSGCGPILVKGPLHCERTIPSQTGISATYENQGAGAGRTVAVSIVTKSLQYTTLTGGCGGIGSHGDGQWDASLKLEATTIGGQKPVGIHVAELPVGFYATGEKSEDPAKKPRFEAEEYPTDLVGKVSKTHSFLLKEGGSTVSCEGGDLDSLIASSSSSLSVDAAYTSCAKFIGSQVSVDMNSCNYWFTVFNSGPPYTGSAAVLCSEPGDGVELIVGNPESPICIYKMPQQFLASATYATTGSLNERKVVAEVSDTSVEYVRTYNGFFCPAASTNGAFSGGFTLEGVE